jgi:hypothetical protein
MMDIPRIIDICDPGDAENPGGPETSHMGDPRQGTGVNDIEGQSFMQFARYTN